MTDPKFAAHVPQPVGGITGVPVSLEESYRVIQVQDPAAPEAQWRTLPVRQTLGQRLAFLSAAALFLGGLFGLALLWTFSFWVH